MKTKKGWFLVIAVIACVLCTVVPVQATDQYFWYNFPFCSIPADPEMNFELTHTTYSWSMADNCAGWDVRVSCHGNTGDWIDANAACSLEDAGGGLDTYTCTGLPSDCEVGDYLDICLHDMNQDCVLRNGNDGIQGYWLITGSGSAPVASFTCTPTIQTIDTSIVCTDTSTNDPMSWYWTIDDETRDIHPLQTSTTRNFTWQSHYPGLYSVNLRVTNSVGSDWENKTNYVNITSAPLPTPTPTPGPTPISGDVRSYFITIDATTQATIYDTNIMLYDTYRGTWTNWTSDADGIGYIDTLPYTLINAYATYTEFPDTYIDASLLGVNAGNSGLDYRISMYPYQAAPEGYVKLYVTTMALQGGTITHASITAIWDNNTYSTDSGSYGTVSFDVPDNMQVHLTARHQGYLDGTKVINVGSGATYSTIVYLNDISYTATPTPTTTGTVYTTIPTVTSGYGGGGGYANAQGQNMLNWLAANGLGLIQLCFMVTVFALLGVRFGK